MKRTISLLLSVIMMITLFTGIANAEIRTPMLPEVNIEDTTNKHTSIRNLKTDEVLSTFDYSVGAGEAIVIIFSYRDSNTATLLTEMENCSWLGNPKVRLMIIDGSDSELKFEKFQTMMSNAAVLNNSNVEVYEATSLTWSYIELIYGELSLIPPLTAIITRENNKNIIKYAYRGAIPLHKITNSLSTIVSDIDIDENSQLTDITISGKRLYDEAYKIFELVNQERAKEGLPALVFDEKVTELAMRRAAECQVYYSHTRPNGTKCFTINDDNYYSEGYLKGENIAIGYQSAEAVMNGWMNSPGHKANILATGQQSIGIGAYVSGNTISWCQLFAANSGNSVTERNQVNTLETIEILVTPTSTCFESGSKEITVKIGETVTLDMLQLSNLSYGWSRCYVKPVIKVKSGGNTITLDKNTLKVTGKAKGDAVLELRAYEESPTCITLTIRVAKEVLIGDFDNNDVVNINDAEYLLKYVLYGANSFPVTQSTDVDGNGITNVDDAEALLRRVLGIR